MASFSKNLFYNYIGTLSVSVAGFLTTPFLIRFLGINLYGSWALLSSLLVFSTLFDFGIGLAGMKLVAEYSLESERKQINELFSNVVAAYCVLSLVFLLIGLCFAPFLRDIFKLPHSYEHQFVIGYIVFLIAAAISFSGSSFSGMLQGLHDFKAYNQAFIIQSLGGVVVVLILGYLTHNLVCLSLGMAGVNIVVWLLKGALLYRKGLRLTVTELKKSVIKRILKFSSSVFVINVAGRIIFDMDTIVIGIFSGTASVASYQVALNPNTALRKIGDQLNSVTLTSSSRLHARGLQKELRELFLNATKYSLIIMLPFLICAIFLAKSFLRTWVGIRFESSYTVVIALAFGITIVNLQATATQIILSMQKHRTLAWVLSIEALCNIGLSIYLLRRFGIIGVALGTTIPTAFTAFFYTLPKAAKHLELSYIAVFKALWKPLAAAIGAIPVILIIKSLLILTHLVDVMAVGVLYVIVYAVLLILLDKTVKQFMSKMINGIRPT